MRPPFNPFRLLAGIVQLTMPRDPRIAANVIWLLVDRALRLGLAFLIGVYLARRLGPDAYGTLTYAQASASVLSFLALASIEAVVVRMLVDEPDNQQEILGSAIALRVAGGFLATVFAIVWCSLLDVQADLSLVVLIISASSLFASCDVLDWLFRKQLRAAPAVAVRAAALLVGFSLRLVAANTESPVTAVATVMLIEAMLIAMGLLTLWRATAPPGDQLRVSISRIRSITAQSSPLILAAIAVGVYTRLGFVVLREVSGNATVGQLGVATVVAEATHALPLAIASSYGPILMANRQEASARFAQRLDAMMRHFTIAGVLVALMTSLVAPWLIEAFFGEAYAESGHLLRLLVWSAVFVYLSIASEFWFIGHDLQKYLVPKTVVAAAVYLACIFLLVPRHGAEGAVLATIISYSVSAFWSNLLFSATRPLFFRQARAFLLVPTPHIQQQRSKSRP